jgi:hypothetical protein
MTIIAVIAAKRIRRAAINSSWEVFGAGMPKTVGFWGGGEVGVQFEVHAGPERDLSESIISRYLVSR